MHIGYGRGSFNAGLLGKRSASAEGGFAMKNLGSAVAASILTIFALTPPGLAARATGASQSFIAANSGQLGLTDRSSAIAALMVIAQVSPGTLMVQEASPDAQGNSDNSGDDGNSADSDNQNGADADQNGDADNGSDSDQSAQSNDNGDNADQNSGDAADQGNGDSAGQEPGYANDSQGDNGGGPDRSGDDSAGR
jgi:hypothetical protein